MTKKGQFIILEGIDGSGKKTQMALLVSWLKEQGIPVETVDFPRYQDNAFGELVGRFLNGEFGQLDKVNPYLAVLPYMIDQLLAKPTIEKWISQGKTVVANRYFTSNVHQIAKFPKGEEREKFRDWLWRVGWGELGIYKPDLVIVLLVPPIITYKLSLKKRGGFYVQEKLLDIAVAELSTKKGKRSVTQEKLLDIAEVDQAHQVATFEEYQLTAQNEPNWVIVDCVTSEEELKEPEEIHQEIVSLLSLRLNF